MSKELKEEQNSPEEVSVPESVEGTTEDATGAAPAQVELSEETTAAAPAAVPEPVAVTDAASGADEENSAAVPAPVPEVSGEGDAVEAKSGSDEEAKEASSDEGAPKRKRSRRRSQRDEDHEANMVALAEEQEIAIDQIDSHALWVIKRLHAKGHKAFLAGGCVRDLLLGRSPKDFDVATSAEPQEVKSIFRNCRLVGRRFLLAHVFFPGGKIIETATFRANPLDELEEEPEDLLLKRDNVYGDEEKDAYRRDLTINGLFYDPVEGKVIDHVNARPDLEAKLVRTIGDPFVRFQEDPVRIVRAIKFATRLGFEIEENTLAAMKEHSAHLEKCAPARLLEEFFRLLQSGHAAHAFKLCAELGVLRALLPEYADVLNHPLEDAEAAKEELLVTPFAQEADGEEEQEAAGEEAGAEEDASDEEGAEDEADGFDADSEPTVEMDEGMMVVSLAEDGVVEASGEADEEADEADENADASATADAEEHDGNDDAQAAEGEEASEQKVAAEERIAATLPPHRTAEERVGRLFRLMGALDQVKERGADVPSEVAFAAFLLPAWEALAAKEINAQQWWDKISYVWGRRLRMTRRDRERTAILLPALTRMQPQFRFGQDARQLTRRSWFRDLMLLRIISLQAEGDDLQEIAAWKVIADEQGADFNQYREGERPRFRRPRRRRPQGNRNRRRRHGGNRRRRA